MIIESFKNLWSETFEVHPQKGNTKNFKNPENFTFFSNILDKKSHVKKKIEVNWTPEGIPGEMAKSDFF